jgi:hypothetical protein
MRNRSRRFITILALVGGLAARSLARVAFAADPRLADADAALQKAIALLEEVEFPPDKPKCDRPRASAITKLEKARERIAKATECSDAP